MEDKKPPDFILIGGQRCGTTSMYSYLIQHSKISAAKRKEIHFFDNNFSKGLTWYLKQFNTTNCYLTGEATPYYIFHPHAPKRIFQYNPNIKLIALLRNPIDRALSHYNHERNLGSENLSFENALEKEKERLKGEVEKMLCDETHYSYNHQHFSYLERGKYAEQLSYWFSIFSCKQFLIISSEEFYNDPQKIANRAFDFLGIPKEKVTKINNIMKLNYKPMSQTVRKKLQEYFQPHNEKLYKILRKNFKWD